MQNTATYGIFNDASDNTINIMARTAFGMAPKIVHNHSTGPFRSTGDDPYSGHYTPTTPPGSRQIRRVGIDPRESRKNGVDTQIAWPYN